MRATWFSNFIAGLTLTLCLAAPATAAEPRTINWNDLQGSFEQIENPFETMSQQELGDLRTHLEWRVASQVRKEDPEFRARAEAALDRLMAANVDVEDLLEQRLKIMEARTKAASATNEELLGQTVRIPGYVLPLEFDGRKVIEFLLVPTVGACIHTPAPPANQVVHVSYPAGIEVEGLFSAVWVEGELMSETRQQSIGYSDGTAPVSSSYLLPAVLVESYE